MSEMVERVARKLEPQAWAALGTGDTLAYQNRRKSSLRKARLAIGELRRPTKAMIDCGWSLLRGNLRPDEIFPHMIDVALKED